MGLAHVVYPAPTPEGMDAWMFDNYQHHRAIDRAAANVGIRIGVYTIYPTGLDDVRGFLEQHQRWHNDMNNALNIPGNDLSDVDFNDDKQKDLWMFLHYQEHLAAATRLGHAI